MPETPELHGRVVKMQKDIEELKRDRRDRWHLDRPRYEELVMKVIRGRANYAKVFLAVDGLRSTKELEPTLGIPHVSLWIILQALDDGGLVEIIDKKGRSPVYAKKPWALELKMDDFVRSKNAERKP